MSGNETVVNERKLTLSAAVPVDMQWSDAYQLLGHGLRLSAEYDLQDGPADVGPLLSAELINVETSYSRNDLLIDVLGPDSYSSKPESHLEGGISAGFYFGVPFWQDRLYLKAKSRIGMTLMPQNIVNTAKTETTAVLSWEPIELNLGIKFIEQFGIELGAGLLLRNVLDNLNPALRLNFGLFYQL